MKPDDKQPADAPPDKLQLLVVADEAETSWESPWIDLVRLPSVKGKPRPKLERWSQHMKFWLDNRSHLYVDIAAIDINFQWDDVAPKYAEAFSPFGLLHAIPMMVMARYSGAPVAFQIYSGDPAKAAQDPTAVTCYGLLKALQGDSNLGKWLDHDHRNVAARVKDELEHLVASEHFSDVVPQLVRDYRRQLLYALDDNPSITLDMDVIREVLSKIEKSSSPAGDLSSVKISIFVRHDRRDMFLRSLFADVEWTDDAVKTEVKNFLLELQSAGGRLHELHDDIVTALNSVRLPDTDGRYPGQTINAAVAKRHPHRDLVLWGAIVFVYLEYKASNNTLTVNQLLHELGFADPGGAHVTVTRILKKAGVKCGPQDYLTILNEQPILDPAVRKAAERYWKRGMTERMKMSAGKQASRIPNPSKLPLPECLIAPGQRKQP